MAMLSSGDVTLRLFTVLRELARSVTECREEVASLREDMQQLREEGLTFHFPGVEDEESSAESSGYESAPAAL